MFTGIIEETGTLRSLRLAGESGQLMVQAHTVLEGSRIGDSIAVNGVCLTVTSLQEDAFTADVMPETVRRSSFRDLRPGMRVNLERAMAANGRFGGHIVSGHIDGTGVIASETKEGNAIRVRIRAGQDILRLVVEKGSIAIDGISLTVASVDEGGFSVGVIPHTGAETTLLGKRPGEIVNLETDIIGKYVERLLLPYAGILPKAGMPLGSAALGAEGRASGSVFPEQGEDMAGRNVLSLAYLQEMGF